MTDDSTAADYDAVAERYAAEIGDEMKYKPVDRAWLNCLAELAAGGIIADVGCGPGQVAAYLHEQGARVLGIDISPGMIAVASARYPEIDFEVGSLLDIPAQDGAWAGAVCPYSILHLADEQRPTAFTELARVLRPDGWLLLSFHIRGLGFEAGQIQHLDDWWGTPVKLDFHYLDPDVIAGELERNGFRVMAVTRRRPWSEGEQQTERAQVLAQKAI